MNLSVTLADRAEGMEQIVGVDRQRGRTPEPESSRRPTGFGLTVEGLSSSARQRLGLSSDQSRAWSSPTSSTARRPPTGGSGRHMLIIGINDRPIEGVDDWRAALDRLRSGSNRSSSTCSSGEQTTYFFLRSARTKFLGRGTQHFSSIRRRAVRFWGCRPVLCCRASILPMTCHEPSKPTILVVDDEDDIRSSLRMILEYEGMQMVEASSGKDAR